ncbi:mimivirus translation initiation factor 4a [Tupanvirus deep ocean]|uniref:Mimivirus translation initiation factor 4a n=2 Tax=Tupanvirus TaxID=2094720 RepID=A0AC62A8Q1_9VIRU|nr:mimivirus translation initiation factor 4a [Tupanvirus deep ocean]QKU34145.1 mimivirus translation initiation factor 4a [Tupanvirus deep ocean]
MNHNHNEHSSSATEDNGESITDIKFNQISLGEHNCNVNKKLGEGLYLLHDFTDAIPQYDETNGPHLKLKTKKASELAIIPLSSRVASGMLIENSKDLTDEEYFSKFVEKKQVVVESLVRQTFAKGYEAPSAVQALAIPELIQGRDALIQFKSGTGKTHAFLFGCLWAFDPMDDQLQFVFVTNSHEVAYQIYEQAMFLLPSAKIALCIGQKKDMGTATSGGFKAPIGTSSLNTKAKTLKEEREEVQKAQIIVCTMGKFYDYLCNKRWVSTNYLKTICTDEFDNIVASRSGRTRSTTVMSTEEQMAAIIKKIPEKTQRVFFSATVSNQAFEIAHSYFRPYDPRVGEKLLVLLDIEDYTLEGIRQYYVQCSTYPEKKDVLLDLLKQCRISQGIIFANRIETANDIKAFLDDQDVQMTSAVFHGNLPALERKNIHQQFLQNKIRLLISTDLTARGLDVQGINVVINFDMPEVLETYIHRVGRSGRYGRKGVAISLILVNATKDERKKVTGINDCSKQSRMEPLPNDLENLL